MDTAPTRLELRPFELIEPLGRGGMGEVWAGRHVDEQLPVAVKLITGDWADSQSYRSLFRNEIEAVAGLDHPGIVTIFDHGVVDERAAAGSQGRLSAGSPYFVMERAEAGTLRSASGLHSFSELRELLLALLDALAHAHARGVVHRDLKPTNVLLFGARGGRRAAKLADFGLAYQAERSSDGGLPEAVGGTPWFMAPEQIRGLARDQGPWTDLYALGCMAYGLAGRNSLFGGRSHAEAVAAQLSEPPPPLEPRLALPEGFEDWLLTLLEKDPGDRFQCAADAALGLCALGDVPGAAGQPLDLHEAPTTPELPSFHTSPVALVLGVPSGATQSKGRRHPAPALPRGWARGPREAASLRVLRAGSSLYGLRSIPMVGRERERDALWEALHDVHTTRRPRLVALEGPAGIGKSRLARWLLQRAHEVGAAGGLRARHSPLPGPGDGLSRVLRERLGALQLEGAELRERLQAALARLGDAEPAERVCGLLEATAPLSPGERQAVWLELLALLARERPLVLVLEDAHWSADALALAELLLAQPGELPVLVVLTVRDDALHERPDQRATLARLLARPGAARVELGPLTHDDGRTLIEQLLHLETGLAARVEERSAGNPMFAVQLVGDWVQRGLLQLGPAGFTLVPGADVAMPDDLHAVWRERIEQVLLGQPDSARSALEIGAALGLVVDRDEWLEACRKSGVSAPPELVSRLARARLVRRLPGAWTFVNAMLRESLERAAIEGGRWRDCQRACAAMLAGSPPGRPGRAERLGRHLLAAGDAAAAVEPLLRGARDRREASEYGLARGLLDEREHALAASGTPASDPRWGEGSVLRARIFLHEARLADVFAEAERAEREAQAHGWTAVGSEALRLLGDAARRQGELQRAAGLYESCIALEPRIDDPHAVAASLWGLGDVCRQRGETQRAAACFARSRELYLRIDDRHGLGDHLIGQADLARQREAWPEARDRYQEALELFDGLGNRYGMTRGWNGLGEVARSRGDLDAAARLYTRAQRTLELVRSADELFPRVNLGLLALRRGAAEEAEETLAGAERDAARLGWDALLTCVELGLLGARARLRRWETWPSLLENASRRLAATQSHDPDLAWAAEFAAHEAEQAGHREWALAASLLASEQRQALKR